jgi:hypothetical protein
VAPNPVDKNLIVKQLNEVGTETTLVRLIGFSGKAFIPAIINRDRNFVELIVKEIPLGIYILEVNSDGSVG